MKQAIRDNLEEILEGTDIVSISPFQKIKIPLRSIKEFQFAFAEDTSGAAQAPGKGKGDKLGQQEKVPERGPQAGDMPGEDIYETEVYAHELQEILDERYNLPNLEEKDKSKTPDEEKIRIRGYKRRGPMSRLARRRTTKRRLERTQSEKRTNNENKNKKKKNKTSRKDS